MLESTIVIAKAVSLSLLIAFIAFIIIYLFFGRSYQIKRRYRAVYYGVINNMMDLLLDINLMQSYRYDIPYVTTYGWRGEIKLFIDFIIEQVFYA